MNSKTIWWILIAILPVTLISWFVSSFIFFVLWSVASNDIDGNIVNYFLGICSLIWLIALIPWVILIMRDTAIDRLFQEARVLAKKNLWKMFRLGIVLGLLTMIFQAFLPMGLAIIIGTGSREEQELAIRLLSMICWLLIIPLNVWFTKIILDTVDGKNWTISNLFSYYSKDFRSSIGYLFGIILKQIIIIIGLLLLIIPGIIFSLRLQFVEYLIIDKKMWPIEAIKASRTMTKGQLMNVFSVLIIGSMIIFIGTLALLIWLIWAIPTAAFLNALFYRHLEKLALKK